MLQKKELNNYKVLKLKNILFFSYLFLEVILKEYFIEKGNLIVPVIVFVILAITFFQILFESFNIKHVVVIIFFIFSYYIIQFFQKDSFFGFYTLLLPMLFGIFLSRGEFSPKVPLAILIILFFIYLYKGFYIGLEPEDFGNSSRNALGYYVLVLATFYYLIFCIRGSINESSTLIALLSFVVALYAFGRSGIAANFMLLSIISIIKYTPYLKEFNFKNRAKKIFLFFFVILIAYFLFIDIDLLQDIYDKAVSRLGNPSEDIRFDLIASFYHEWEIVNLITGFVPPYDSLINTFNGNVHNSYLEFVQIYGLFAVVIILLLFLKVSNLLLKKISIFFLIIPFLFRIFFDNDGFASIGFILIIGIIFLRVHQK